MFSTKQNKRRKIQETSRGSVVVVVVVVACEPAPVLLCGVVPSEKRLFVAGAFFNWVGRESKVRCPVVLCAWLNLVVEPKTSVPTAGLGRRKQQGPFVGLPLR